VNGCRLKIFAVCALLAFAARQNALACATCYGASDEPMARGMNWGIMTLLVVVLSVFGGVTMFFVHTARRAAALEQHAATSNQTDTKQ